MSLDDISVARVNKSLGLLEKYGEQVRYPHTKYIRDGLFELRITGIKHIRIFFVFRDKEIVLLHAFVKKTNIVPKKEIEYALALKRQLQ
ncbi:MAG: type II toxin-antitoxin system RelE/ParE family toxin [Patescibacteria group bacterium]